jgi:uncharacterized protein
MTFRLKALGVWLRPRLFRFPSSLLLAMLRAYKYAISPTLLPACRYVPTCSEYAADAVERHGVLRGTLMGLWRLLRCHPFARGGFDPVPHSANSSADDSCWRVEMAATPFSDASSHLSH